MGEAAEAIAAAHAHVDGVADQAAGGAVHDQVLGVGRGQNLIRPDTLCITPGVVRVIVSEVAPAVDDVHDVLGMGVVLGKDQRLGNSGPPV